jgi:hypothetical protein
MALNVLYLYVGLHGIDAYVFAVGINPRLG